jgi:crotonobetaine/carnitine-CoA ligase
VAARRGDLGDRTLVSFGIGEASLTYREADELSGRVAANLAAGGVGPGDTVLVMMRNRVEFVLTWLGLARIGAVQVPVNVDYTGVFLEQVANQSGARTLVVEADLLGAVVRSAGRLEHLRRVLVVGDDVPAGAADAFAVGRFDELLRAGDPPPFETRPQDIAGIYFTSGTTGRSKGAMVTNAQAHLLAERHQELMRMGEGDVFITHLPLFHINAQVLAITNAMLVGASARLEAHFSASRWLRQVRDAGATHTGLLGVMLSFLLKQPPTGDDAESGLRCVWTVPCPGSQARQFKDRFGVGRLVSSYGCTEVGMVASQDDDGGPLGSAGRVGTDWYEAAVVDPETDEPVGPGVPGEMVVRGRVPWVVTPGYVGSPEETLRAMRNQWFHTGDLVRRDEEGRIWFVDRVRDCIRRRGENIASVDVEAVLTEHPAVADAAVVGVASAEPGGEQEILACVVLAAGCRLGAEEVWAWCEERLPHFAVPRYVEVAPELPRTPTGKVTKYALRERGLGEHARDRGPSVGGTRRVAPVGGG